MTFTKVNTNEPILYDKKLVTENQAAEQKDKSKTINFLDKDPEIKEEN